MPSYPMYSAYSFAMPNFYSYPPIFSAPVYSMPMYSPCAYNDFIGVASAYMMLNNFNKIWDGLLSFNTAKAPEIEATQSYPFNYSSYQYQQPIMPNFFTPIDFSSFFKVPEITKPIVKKTAPINTQKSYDINTKSNLPQLEDVNYDEAKAKDLVNSALTNAESKPIGYCARYVKNAIANTGLGAYQSGHAYQCDDVLAGNSNFKEINVSGSDLKKLPAGCVIVYDRGAAGYSSQYGHIEITTGKGNAVSDFVSRTIKESNDVRVFVPVKQVA